MGNNRILNKVLCQSLKVEAQKATAAMPARLYVIRAGAPLGQCHQGTSEARLDDQYAGRGGTEDLRRDC
jgi:hypothetical protein